MIRALVMVALIATLSGCTVRLYRDEVPWCTIELYGATWDVEFSYQSDAKDIAELYVERGWSNIRIDRSGDDSVLADCQ